MTVINFALNPFLSFEGFPGLAITAATTGQDTKTTPPREYILHTYCTLSDFVVSAVWKFAPTGGPHTTYGS